MTSGNREKTQALHFVSDYQLLFNRKKILMFISDAMIESYSSVLWDIMNIATISDCEFKIHMSRSTVPRVKFGRLSKAEFSSKESRTSEKICNTFISLLDTRIQLQTQSSLPKFKHKAIDFNWFNDQLPLENLELKRSIYSTFLSRNLFTLVCKPEGYISKRLLKFDYECFEFGKLIARDALENDSADLVLVPNGRYPVQVGMKQEAQRLGAQILYYEKFRNRTFLQSFQTQDNSSMADHFLSWQSRTSERDKALWREWSKSWLERQRNSIYQNPYIIFDDFDRNRSGDFGASQIANKSVVPIFSSSLDERLSNVSFDLNGWSSQNEAIGRASRKVREWGQSPHVRLHPNLMSKSLRELLEIVAFLKRNNISFQFPWQGPSTYELLDNAKFIVTWGATVSLESTAQGTPAINLGKTKFNSLTDIHELNPTFLDSFKFFDLKEPNIEKSLEAIYMVQNYGIHGIWKGRPEIAWKSGMGDKNLLKSAGRVVNELINYIFVPGSIKPRHIFKLLELIFGSRKANVLMSSFTNFLTFLLGNPDQE